MTYTCTVKPENELIKEIEKKVAKSTDATSIKIGKTFHEFVEIKMRRDDLLFNTENDRTLTRTREFVEDNHYESDYFSLENATNQHVQQDYYDIVVDFIPKEMQETFNKTRFQRDPIYINRGGVIANGNTRAACFRKNSNWGEFDELVCLVIPENFHNDWAWIRRMVDAQDNAPKFSADYPWYARAERLELNFEASDKSPVSFDEISRTMEYNTPKEAKLFFNMLQQARVYIKYSKKYNKLTELDGGKSNKQALETLAKHYYSNPKVPPAVLDFLQTGSFELMEEPKKAASSKYSSVHLGIATMWNIASIEATMRDFELKDNSKTPNVVGGEKKTLSNNAADFFKDSNIDDEERDKKFKEYLEKSRLRKEASTRAKKNRLFADKLEDINTSLANITDDYLDEETDLKNTESMLATLKDQLSKTIKKEKAIRNSQNKI